MKLSPPTKIAFNISVILGIVALLLYFAGVFGVVSGGFAAVAHLALWVAVAAWAVLLAGVSMKGV
ncbi:MAG: hypothetical protein VX871_10245 [Pseudomonadota bacterium]|nr:hypothetical protein [Pseudomonadota bacterium]